MEKTAILLYLAVIVILHTQLVLAVYSNACNKTALIKQDKELGLRGGKIPDINIKASSFSDSKHQPSRGRLDQQASGNQASSWCSKYKDKKQYLLIELVDISVVTGIATQGQYDPVNKTSSNYSMSWVTQYKVEYSSDNKAFYPIEYKYDRPLIFKGNSDGNSVVCNNFPYTVKTKYLRIQPLAWNTSICLRVGLFGQLVGGNVTGPAFFTPNDKPDHETWWWWIFFWVILAFLLLVIFLGLLIYCCIIRRRMYSQEKVLKEKSVKAPIQKRPESSYVNDAYDMTVMTNKTSVPDTPQDVEDTGDEIQEVTAEFTADEQENQKGIVGFSVTDDTKDDSDDEVANGDVNWDAYKKRALSKRSEHAYENVDFKSNP